MSSAVITGATGFIGRWLIAELLKNKIKVLALVRNKCNLATEYLENELFSYIEIDLLSPISIEQVLLYVNKEDSKYDFFFHLAWGGVSPNLKNDFIIQSDNIKLAMNSLLLCKEMHCKRFIATGTVAEYVFSKGILNVNEKQTPNDLYGAAKTSAHYFLEVKARQLKQNFIWAVIPSTYGEFRKDNNIITYTIKSLLLKEKPVYGNLTQMWDFLYVSDVARALLLIAEKGKNNYTYGIGSGTFLPLISYITKIKDLIDSNLPLGIGEISGYSAQTFSSCVNIVELIRDTGFLPKVSFEEGIKKTIKYWRKQLQLK
ncbi:MAG: NAD-dependent epimerase/dehydratase family protein [Succinivibrio sp.]|nr:NAD-dependent epimerase/dehydratase family protein [Succinivibrio sp.]